MPFWNSGKKSGGDVATPGIRIDFDPAEWRSHRFGLSEGRWKGLHGKQVWITGAGTGYGRAVSVALACAGAELFLTGRRKEMLLESVEEIKLRCDALAPCHILPADITDPTQVKDAIKSITNETESLYGLIHCAAMPTKNNNNPLQNESVEDWEAMFRLNVTAPWVITREIFPHMMRGGSARVIFFSSGAAWAFSSGFGPYNVSKAALNSLTGSLAEELSGSYPGKDIQINAIQPGEARTEMNQGSDISPFAVVNMTLLLLSHPKGGPNGKFFHRDGRQLIWGQTSL